jgi:hypothetical protein
MSDHKGLGTCCACGKEGADVKNFIILDKRAPVPGTGWGCMVCHKPMDGALAVVCDGCLAKKAPVKWVIYGQVWKGERVSIETVKAAFYHDLRCHPEACLN